MNPLEKGRGAAGRAWGRARRGTTRTALWVKDGVTGSAGRARDRVRGLRSDTGESKSEPPASSKAAAKNAGADAGDQPGRFGSLVERAQSDRRLASALVAGGALLLVWICWTAYVWDANGSTAGLGVLISWPAVFLAAALVAMPFVGAGVLVHRHRLAAADGAPALNGDDTEASPAKDATEEAKDALEEDEDESDEAADGEAEEAGSGRTEDDDAEDEGSDEDGDEDGDGESEDAA